MLRLHGARGLEVTVGRRQINVGFWYLVRQSSFPHPTWVSKQRSLFPSVFCSQILLEEELTAGLSGWHPSL